MRKWVSAFHHASIKGIRYESIAVVVCAVLGFSSLCFHWDESDRGYQLFWHLRKNLDDEPVAATCLQLILVGVFAFLVVSLFSIVRGNARFVWLNNRLQKARYVSAVCILIMWGFLVFSGLLSVYGMLMNSYLRPILVGFNYASFLNSQNLGIFPTDMPFGFWEFLTACGLLALVTVASKPYPILKS
jgi:hypothetical protein